MGVDRMVVTHAQFEVVNLSLDQMKKAAAMGAKLELCAMGTLMGPTAHLAWIEELDKKSGGRCVWRQLDAVH